MNDEYGDKLAPYHKKVSMTLITELTDFANSLSKIYDKLSQFLAHDFYLHIYKPVAAMRIANMFIPSNPEDILRDRDKIDRLYKSGKLLEPMSFLKYSDDLKKLLE